MKETVITLKAGLDSDLNWESAREEALKIISKGKKVLWHVDLGLFDRLTKPLDHAGQYKSLALALDHFKEKIWREFYKFSKGLILYKGSPFFKIPEDQKNFQEWLKERNETEENDFIRTLYARDVAADYISQLAERVPDEIPTFVLFDEMPDDVLLKILLSHPDAFGKVKILGGYSWNLEKEVSYGILMPKLENIDQDELSALIKKIPEEGFKLIPESVLTSSWDGLDQLIYSEKLLSPLGKRKVLGFIAAGGEVVPI